MPPLGASTILLPKIFPQFKVKELSQFPIRTINFSDTTERVRHDRMVTLVEAMLAAKRQLPQARTDRDRNFYASKRAALDRQMVQLVDNLRSVARCLDLLNEHSFSMMGASR